MEKLKSILELKFIRNIPRENKMAYLISVGMGAGAGVGVMILMNAIFFIDYDFNKNNLSLLFSNLLPIFALIFLFILSRKFLAVWKNMRTRIVCLFFLLFAYIVGFYFITCLVQSSGISCFLMSFLAPIIAPIFSAIFLLANPIKSPLLTTLLYSIIFIAITSYLATKGITNSLKRIILFLVIGFLVYIIAVTPLITMSAFY
jgi:hypothetical protein